MSFEDMIAADPVLNRWAAYTACREYVRLDTACIYSHCGMLSSHI